MGLFRKIFLTRFAALAVLTLSLSLASDPDAALAASPDSPPQSASEKAVTKSEAAEAWDAVKNTTNPSLLEAFIKRYGTTFFADIAKAGSANSRRPRPSHRRLTEPGGFRLSRSIRIQA